MPAFNTDERRRIACIGESYRRLTGRSLIAPEGDPVAALLSAPLAVVAPGTEPDPIFYFGNARALAVFEMNFADFTRLPSRLSAEPMLQEERARLLDRVVRQGIISDYAGVRVSATGRRFLISDASVWTLSDESGAVVGQAAAFAGWTYVDRLE